MSEPQHLQWSERWTRWQVRTCGPDLLPSELWFAVEPENRDMLATGSDAALLGLLIPAMRQGVDLVLDGNVSVRLLEQARGELQTILQAALPGLQSVRISAQGRAGPEPASAAVGLGFSAGIDALFSVLQHRERDLLRGRLESTPTPDHLQFFNVGSHGVNGREVFEARRGRIIDAAVALGFPLLALDSNLDDFFDLSFQLTHVVRNAAAAHVLSEGMGVALMSSTGVPLWDGRQHVRDLAQAEDLLLPACSSERLVLASAGASWSRVEKTRLVANHPVSFRILDVCQKSRVRAGNCSSCRKCLRTMLTLDVLGRLEEYEHVFDIRRYRRLRPLYAAYVWISGLPLTDEVLAFARAEHFAPVLAARRWRWLARLAVRAWRVLDRLNRRLPAGLHRRLRRAWNSI